MLVRFFRVTDKFSNAGLKLAVWLSSGFLDQIVYLRESLETLFISVFQTVTVFFQGIFRVSRSASETAVKAYQAGERQRRLVMAQRAAGMTSRSEAKPISKETVIEDPLLGQNRLLSAFTVLLLVSLIAIVLWATQREDSNGDGFGGFLPQNDVDPTTERLPSPEPTSTTAPVVFSEWRGTLVFSVHEAGQEDIFALQRGSSAPIRLTNDPAIDRDPALSPDGRLVAFASNRDGFWRLFVMDLVTKQTRPLPIDNQQHFVGAPTWSPDGVFLAYEAYSAERQNLDIYIAAVDGSQLPAPLTQGHIGPDFEPAWRPTFGDEGGRHIAFTSIRNGQQDIYVIDLNNPNIDTTLNLTNSPDINEDYAAWSPDGQYIAYSAVSGGIEEVFYRRYDRPVDEEFVGRGRMPVWNPVDSTSIFYTQQRRENEYRIVGGSPIFGESGSAALVDGIVADLDWTSAEPTISAVIANYPPVPPPSNVAADSEGLYNLAVLQGIDVPDPHLNARVYASFNALRLAALNRIGLDFLAQLEDAFWALDRAPEIGQDRRSWHYAGRAFGLPRTLVSEGNQIVVVREDRDVGTYWRVYVRVAEQAQSGLLGEPLRRLPWDFASRTTNDVEAFEQGGRLMTSVPSGYYVDFTQLVADYGWEPIPSGRTWRQSFPHVLFWVFINTDGLTWEAAMRELYTDTQIDRFLNNQPVETVVAPTQEEIEPVVSPTATLTRTPTPQLPDLQ